MLKTVGDRGAEYVIPKPYPVTVYECFLRAIRTLEIVIFYADYFKAIHRIKTVKQLEYKP